jgi:hypothetical protein
MSPDRLEIGEGLLGALSEGQRAMAHLVVILVVLVAGGLVYFIRRARRRDEARGRQGLPEEER